MVVNHGDGKENCFMTLQLQDLTGKKIACALWDSYAVMLNKYISENHSDDSPVVIFLQMAKLKEWGGKPHMGNCLFGSRLYINEAIGPIVRFQERLSMLLVNLQAKQHNLLPKLSSQIQLITICVSKSSPLMKFMSKIRVTVVIRVQDSTGSSSFVLFGRLIEKLIHRSDASLMDKIAKDQGRQNFPEELNALLNRRFVFKIQISAFNLESDYSAYTIHKCTDDESVVDPILKQSPDYEQEIVNVQGTPTTTTEVNKVVDTIDDNINVVDVETVTPETNVGKRHIELVEGYSSYECSSSKADAPVHILKIPKMEKLE